MKVNEVGAELAARRRKRRKRHGNTVALCALCAFSRPILMAAAFFAGAVFNFAGASAPLQQTDVFVSGEGGYHTYRIPALIVTSNQTLLAFCEGRKNSASDTGDIDLLLKRSTDGGKTWSEPQVVWDDGL